jgi:hypothetical protein
MNLQTLSALVAVGLGSRQEAWLGTIPALINEGLNQIQQRRSFNCMKLTISFNLDVSGPGPFSYALPTTFKELQSGPNALYATTGAPYGNSIWRIFTRQEVMRLTQIGINVAERTAYLEQDPTNNNQWTIYFPGPMDEGSLPPDTTFSVDTYSFLSPVVNPTDENDLMKRYPMLILEQCKALVYSLGSDPDSIAGKNEALKMTAAYFSQASADDNSHSVRGRTSRMMGF